MKPTDSSDIYTGIVNIFKEEFEREIRETKKEDYQKVISFFQPPENGLYPRSDLNDRRDTSETESVLAILIVQARLYRMLERGYKSSTSGYFSILHRQCAERLCDEMKKKAEIVEKAADLTLAHAASLLEVMDQ